MSKTNGIDPNVAKEYVGLIERELSELASMQGEYMASCRSVRERITSLKDQAADAGIPRKALNVEIKRRGLERKVDKLISDLDTEDKITVDMLRQALGSFGDTPLGGAAMARAEKDEGKAAKGKGGRKKKDQAAAEAPPPAAAEGGGAADPLSTLVEGQEPDVRPSFMRRADQERADENQRRLEGDGGITGLKH